MAEESTRFSTTPNELRAEGRDDLGGIALSLTVDKGGVVVEIRTGTFSKEELKFTYGDMSDVELLSEVNFGFQFQTPGTTYTVTNVTPERQEAEQLVEFMRERIRRVSVNGSDATAQEEGDAVAPTDGGRESPDTAAADDAGATEQLKKWAELREQGVITDDEFEQKKRELL